VNRNGPDRTVVMSADEYHSLKRRDRQVLSAGELPNDIVEAISRAALDPRHQHLDEQLKDWAS
jgi:hypothetical protein